MCHLSKKDQYVCQINQGIAEAVTGVLGGAQFPLCPFYHPRSSRCRLGHTREADVCAGNVPDSNGISGDFKRQKRSHQTEPVPHPTTTRGFIRTVNRYLKGAGKTKNYWTNNTLPLGEI